MHFNGMPAARPVSPLQVLGMLFGVNPHGNVIPCTIFLCMTLLNACAEVIKVAVAYATDLYGYMRDDQEFNTEILVTIIEHEIAERGETKPTPCPDIIRMLLDRHYRFDEYSVRCNLWTATDLFDTVCGMQMQYASSRTPEETLIKQHTTYLVEIRYSLSRIIEDHERRLKTDVRRAQ